MNSGERRRRELHLHVGLPKTGTTYLQQSLTLNRDVFAAEGFVLGPMQDERGAHHRLAWMAREKGAGALADVLVAAPGERLLVSSEVFSDLLAQPDRAAELHRALAPNFDVTIYVTLRRPDLMKESAYAEVAKNMRRLAPIRVEPDPSLAGRTLLYDDPDFDRRLAIMEESFGRAALRVSVYRDDKREDPLTAFRRSLGLAPLEDARRPKREANVALPRRKTMALAAFAKDDPALVALALETARATRRVATDAPKFLLSPAQRRAVVELYRDGLARIVERHALEGGAWLLSDPAEDPDWIPARPIARSEFVALGVGMARRALRRSGLGGAARLVLAARGFAHALDAARFARHHPTLS